MPHSQGLSPIIPILSRINPITHIDTYLFKVHSNIVLQSTQRSPKTLFSESIAGKILKALLPSSTRAKYPIHLNLLDLITLTILGEQYKL